MKKIDDDEKVKNIIQWFKSIATNYSELRNNVGNPVISTNFDLLLNNTRINIFNNDNDSYKFDETFITDSYSNSINVILDNFERNSKSENLFNSFYVLSCLSNANNYSLESYKKSQTNPLNNIYSSFPAIQENINVNGLNVTSGLDAITELVNQYCTQQCFNNVISKDTSISSEKVPISYSTFDIETSLSDNIYSPLETYVKNYSKHLGYANFNDFCSELMNGKINIVDTVNNGNILYLANIGKLYEQIIQDNFPYKSKNVDYNITSVIKYLESKEFSGRPSFESGFYH